MSSSIDRKTLGRLAELARIELDPKEEGKLLNDLGRILDHFKELQELNTANVTPMAGGSSLKNVFREDCKPFGGLRAGTNRGEGVEQFPENENGYLKIPPVFE